MSKRNDISQQIRKYLNGELDARAMHQLEREALNDPFLAEALEGYEKASINQEQNLSDIHTRLRERIDGKRRRVILWRTISIAASVLIVLTIGGIWLKNEQPVVQFKRVANIDKIKPAILKTDTQPVNTIARQSAKVSPPSLSKRSFAGKKASATTTGASELASAAPSNKPGYNSSLADAGVQKDSARLGEVVVTGYGTAKRKTAVTGSVAEMKVADIKDKDSSVNALSGKVAGVQINVAGKKTIKGVVIAKEDGLPIPGVSVIIKGTKIATQTNSNGRFTINSVPDGSILDIRFIGYESQQVLVHKKDSVLITMQASSNQLNEVVVTSALGIKSEQEYQSARPRIGWSDYKKYLKDNALSPDGATGVVKLSFVVNEDNSLSDFKIIKSVSAKTDSAAIELVKNGTGWLCNSDNKPHKVRLRIKFIAE